VIFLTAVAKKPLKVPVAKPSYPIKIKRLLADSAGPAITSLHWTINPITSLYPSASVKFIAGADAIISIEPSAPKRFAVVLISKNKMDDAVEKEQ
jgi:hypothetical protein